MESLPPNESEESPNWLELPRDVTIMILSKLRVREILESAQFVCKWWHNACKDPSMWRAIHMEDTNELELHDMYEKMTRCAVDRSSGGLVSLIIEGFGTNDLLAYISDRSSLLKYLRLQSCYSLDPKLLAEALRKFPSLQELELTLCQLSPEDVKIIVGSCPILKTIKLNEIRDPYSSSDEVAFIIAQSMPGLVHLQLIGNSMTDVGLQAILDGIPCLESLDMRACPYVRLFENLRRRCTEQIKHVRCPCDSTRDYKFVTRYDGDFKIHYVNEAGEYHFDFDFDSQYGHYEMFSDDDSFDDFGGMGGYYEYSDVWNWSSSDFEEM